MSAKQSPDARRIKTAVMHMHVDIVQYENLNCSDLGQCGKVLIF